MSRCYQNVIHVQLTYFYLCIFHWRPTDNLYHCWVIMYYRLNRSFMRSGFVLFFVSFFSWNQTLLRICNSATSSCGVHSDRKLEWPKEESPAQSNVKRPKCDFERLTDCCNKVNNKSCSDWMSGCLGANGTTPSAWPWDWPVQITHLLTLCF